MSLYFQNDTATLFGENYINYPKVSSTLILLIQNNDKNDDDDDDGNNNNNNNDDDDDDCYPPSPWGVPIQMASRLQEAILQTPRGGPQRQCPQEPLIELLYCYFLWQGRVERMELGLQSLFSD